MFYQIIKKHFSGLKVLISECSYEEKKEFENRINDRSKNKY